MTGGLEELVLYSCLMQCNPIRYICICDASLLHNRLISYKSSPNGINTTVAQPGSLYYASSTYPNASPTLTFFPWWIFQRNPPFRSPLYPSSKLGLTPFGASKTRTMVLPS